MFCSSMTQFVGPLDYKGLYEVKFSIQFNPVQNNYLLLQILTM